MINFLTSQVQTDKLTDVIKTTEAIVIISIAITLILIVSIVSTAINTEKANKHLEDIKENQLEIIKLLSIANEQNNIVNTEKIKALEK